ncbi:MAG TPA: hypothetical protein VH186_02475 [Chloroflexia bacterium]|nr:hypothetical protein [Chloroflexia bacterium]
MTDAFLSTRPPFGIPDETMESITSNNNVSELLVGEVVETSLTGYVAQTYRLDEPPPFGGLVRVKDRAGNYEIYGAVYHIATGGLDTGRRAAPRGNGQPPASDEQVYTDNPQLARLLKTEFGVLVLGTSKTGPATDISSQKFAYVFPDYPPPLHYSVTLCSDQTLINFTREKAYLRTLIEAAQVPSEELVAAILRRAARARAEMGRPFLVDSLRYLARLLKQDYDRFKVIVEKCEVA